jgi:small subunit ribosomal protein S19
MSRSTWKGPFINKNLLEKKEIKKIWFRNSIIPGLIEEKKSVYDGKMFKTILINNEKIGFKFGEFSFSRKIKNNKEKKNESKRK